MRQAGTLRNGQQARRFTDYLMTLGIVAHVEEDSDGWIIWVRDENQIEQAKQELADFRVNPDDARYRGAADKADAIRRERIEKSERARKNVVEMRQRWNRPATQRCPMVLAMIAVSVLVFLLSGFGTRMESVASYLTLTELKDVEDNRVAWSGKGLSEIKKGQIWRLVTPIFVHLGPWHIFFNMYVLYFLGSQVEERRSTWRFALMVLVLAVASNLAEYRLNMTLPVGHLLAGRIGLQEWYAEVFALSPAFGGMSGVAYGLFGYIWMKTLYDPGSGLYLARSTVVIMIVWFFLCLFNIMGGITNTAHAVGLGLGIAIGYAPVLFESFKPR